MARCLFSLLLSVLVTAAYSAEAPTNKEESAAGEWLDRAQAYAEKAKGDDPWTIWLMVAVSHARAGRLEEARAVLNRTEEPERFEKFLLHAGASGGHRDAAIRFAETIEDRERRDDALVLMVVAENGRHDFANAVKTVDLIEDAASASRAWRRIARAQAEAGLYEAARKIAAKMLIETDDQQEDAVETLAFIAKAEAAGWKKPPVDVDASFAEQFRGTANKFTGPKLFTNDVAEIKAKAEAIKEATARSWLWLQIGWLCHKAGDPDGCRQAIDAALGCADEMSDGYQKSLAYVLIADLVIERGDLQEARGLVDKAREVEKDLGIFRGLSSFTTAPVAVGVLIRCGKIEEAFEMAETYGDEGDSMIWLALGLACTSVGKRDEVEKRLEEIESDEIKGYLCLGVWQALQKGETHELPQSTE